MKWKQKLIICIILDFIDFVLGGLALLLESGSALTVFLAPLAPFASIINNVRGIIYDVITTSFLVYNFGTKGFLGLIEVAIPEELDFVLPIATLVALSSRKKK